MTDARFAERHATRAGRALQALAEADPAIGALALWCLHRDGPETRTDDETILYGPDFPHLPLREQIGLAAHHVLHVALRHGARMGAMAERTGDRFDAELYGLATDAVVNEALVAAGHGIPRPAVTLSGVLAAIGQSPASPEAALAEWDADRLFLHLLGRSAGTRAAAREHGRAKGYRADLGRSRPGRSGDEGASEWRGRVTRAMEAGRRAGTGIGNTAARLALLRAPKTPWEVHLRRLVTRAVSEVPRRSHRRPAGRWIAAEAEARAAGTPAPVFEPGRARDAKRPRVVVGLDTSSSVDALTMALFAAEAAGIARRTGAETRVLCFDERVHTDVTMGPGNWERAITGQDMRRGGGTSFVDILARADALAPSVVVLLTDLEGPFGPEPRAPVIWAVPGDPAAEPPFGRVLVLAG